MRKGEQTNTVRRRSTSSESASCTYFERSLRARFDRAIRGVEAAVVLAVAAPSLLACHTPEDTPENAADAGDEIDAFCTSVTIDGAFIEPDAEGGCSSFRTLPCGLSPEASIRDDCYLDLQSCKDHCDLTGLFYCQLPPTVCDGGVVFSGVPLLIECNTCAISGRRPMGLVPANLAKAATVGNYFASMAHLEAASVRAFVDLAGWLDALGAPASLGREALRSAQDERRHARVTTRFARRFGSKRPRARARTVAPPTLAALLEDNVIEGCARETFGALLVTWQARHAEDPEIRRALARIAIDETRHAALAWATLAWGIERIRHRATTSAPSDRHTRVTIVSQLRSKMESALAGLQRDASIEVTRATRQITGHPTPRVAKLLVAQVASLVRAESKTLL